MNNYFELKERDNGALICGRIDFNNAEKLRFLGNQYLQKTASTNLTFDLSGIEQSNISGISILLCWLRQAKALGKTVSYVNMPTVMQKVATLCGVQTLLEVDAHG